MVYNTETCKKIWAEEKKRSFETESYKKPEAWQRFWDYLSTTYHGPNERADVNAIVELLHKDDAIFEKCRVLDIGCGPGTFSLPFLKAGAGRVDCIDNSPGMIAQLKKDAETAKLQDRVGIHQCMWDEFKSTEKYDLVFSSMSPAISEYDELMRMEVFSREYCCLVTYANGGSRYTIQNMLWKAMNSSRVKSSVFDVIHPFNILYSMGRHPNLMTFYNSRKYKEPLEIAYEKYLLYFEIFGYTSEENKRTIRKCLEDMACDGFCHEDSSYHNCAIWWRIPQ